MKLFSVILCAFSIWSTFELCLAQHSRELSDAIVSGDRLWNEGKVSEAINIWLDYDDKQKSPELIWRLAVGHEMVGQVHTAESYYERLVNENPFMEELALATEKIAMHVEAVRKALLRGVTSGYDMDRLRSLIEDAGLGGLRNPIVVDGLITLNSEGTDANQKDHALGEIEATISGFATRDWIAPDVILQYSNYVVDVIRGIEKAWGVKVGKDRLSIAAQLGANLLLGRRLENWQEWDSEFDPIKENLIRGLKSTAKEIEKTLHLCGADYRADDLVLFRDRLEAYPVPPSNDSDNQFGDLALAGNANHAPRGWRSVSDLFGPESHSENADEIREGLKLLAAQRLQFAENYLSSNDGVSLSVAQLALASRNLEEVDQYGNRCAWDGTEELLLVLKLCDLALEELRLARNRKLRMQKRSQGASARESFTGRMAVTHWISTGGVLTNGAVINDLGMQLITSGDLHTARGAFIRASRLASRAGDWDLYAKALGNRIQLDLESNRWKRIGTGTIRKELSKMGGSISKLPEGLDRTILTLRTAQLLDQLAERMPQSNTARSTRRAAYEFATRGLVLGRRSKDWWAQSIGLGLQGKLNYASGNLRRGAKLTREALRYCQMGRGNRDGRVDFLSFRWLWQLGRFLRNEGMTAKAIPVYKLAGRSLETIQQDLVFGLAKRASGAAFRRDVGAYYYELADLYFRQAGSPAEATQESLRNARRIMEGLRSALLEGYFSDPSVYDYRTHPDGGKRFPVFEAGKVAARISEEPAAVLYVIPFAKQDRNAVELLLEIPEKGNGTRLEWHHAEDPVSREACETWATRLRYKVMMGKEDYFQDSKRLYDVLIRPVRKRLDERGIKTLVVVAEGALSSIPIGLLHDGNEFVVDRYRTVVLPDLLLMDEDVNNQYESGTQSLVASLSEEVEDMPKLTYAKLEAKELNEILKKSGSKRTNLQNSSFMKKNFMTSFKRNYDIVHIASHAHFDPSLEKTFVLTYGDGAKHQDPRLSPWNLEEAIRSLSFRGRPLEMLVLSACDTATGSDRATLGLAGIAVKAGAHSAVASLWPVKDEATQQFMVYFYNFWIKEGLSKAEALQRAKQELSDDTRFAHPRNWAPFVLIGNWLSPEQRKRVYSQLINEFNASR